MLLSFLWNGSGEKNLVNQDFSHWFAKQLFTTPPPLKTNLHISWLLSHPNTMDDSDLIISFNPPPSPSLFSWACTGHHELWRDKGAACTHHVVAAWSITEKKRRGKHLHQESWQVHWQQGSLWHLLRFWQHPVLQGKAFLPLSLPFVTGNLKAEVEVAQQVVWLYSHARALLETMCYRVVKSILPLTHFFTFSADTGILTPHVTKDGKTRQFGSVAAT